MNAPFKLTLIFLLFALKGAFAQNNLPAVFGLKTDTAEVYTLAGNYSQLLEDPEDKYTIVQVASPAFNSRFHANTTAQTGVNRKIRTYWFRFRIQNQLNRDVELYFDSPLLYLDLFNLNKTGHWQKQQTGSLLPWSQRDGLKYAKKLPYTLKRGQETLLYQRVQAFGNRLTELPPPSFRLKGRFLEDFYSKTVEQEGERSILLNGIMIGVLLIAIFYNLAIFWQVRERAYLYFFLWALPYLIIRFVYPVQVPALEEYRSFIFLVFPYLAPLSVIGLVLFIRSFLQTQKRLPKWDRAFIAAGCWYVLGNLLFQFFIESPVSFLDKLSQITVLGLSFIYILLGLITIQLARKSDRSAGFLLLAIIPRMLLKGIVDGFLALSFLVTNNNSDPGDIYYSLTEITFIWMVIIFSGGLIRRYNQTRKELAEKALEKERLEREKEIERSQLIEAQKVELEKQVAERTAELKQSLDHLKATQTQLIQSEKLASLGELTAGIAHEIQNPLNFVNNFSEVSRELVEELRLEQIKPNRDSSLEEDLLTDLDQNLEKISLHGRRADSIVKGMLQHSRASSGEKQATDLNALAEEYLRLAYQGMRAKDKEFNSNLITDFDTSLEKVEVVPQELGRVLLNLYNNAFYATQQKKAQLNGQYQPEVKVSTAQQDGRIEIKVRDNGTGMPDKVRQKIFQPFFTTKPTGQGTGLGLSLSYDIITKGHQGEIKVKSQEGEYSEFILNIPC